MRQELELMQKIEQYLLGEMRGEEASVFESEMHANKELYEQVELQKQLMKGIQRSAWRQDAVHAFAKYSFMQNLLKWSFIGTSVIVISLGVGYFLNKEEPGNKKELLTENAVNETLINNQTDTANIYQILNGNTFVINSSRDTIVKTKEGNLVEIPKEIFNDTLTEAKKDSSFVNKKTGKEVTQAKIYTLHFYTPSYKDSLKKWKQSVQDKNYSKALRSMLSSANPKNYLKTSSKDQRITEKDTVSAYSKDTMYKAVFGLNMEKIDNDMNSKNSKLYKLKGKIPFINKTSKNKNTILVFDVDNKNKTSIDTAIVIEVVDKLKSKSIITKHQK